MGYTFKIGNAVPEFSKDDGYLRAEWVVEPTALDDAPTFPNDSMTGNGNDRSPSYSVWADFCRDTGILDVFYDERGHLHAGHPGCVMLKRSDLERVREARVAWEKTATLPPGFEGWPVYDDATKTSTTPDEGKYDPYLARLIWLEWWMAWALDNCETPAIENY
jgi:hypothetical protein